MNIFGVEIQFSNSNGKYIKRKECHQAHENLQKYLDERFNDTNKRIDDFMGSVNNYINLLKNNQ
jgi:hypothetical protein